MGAGHDGRGAVGLSARRLGAAFLVVVLVGTSARAGRREEYTAVRLGVTTSKDKITLRYELGDYQTGTVQIGDHAYSTITFGKEGLSNPAGAPDLPSVARSIVIPDDAEMQVSVVKTRFVDVANVDIAPSKGIFDRNADPAQIPYAFGRPYSQDAFYPGTVASLGEPYILHGVRGVTVSLFPFQYNPAGRLLRVYKSLILEVTKAGVGKTNVLQRARNASSLSSPAYATIYQSHFENSQVDPNGILTPPPTWGRMLIVCHDDWLTNIQALVNHKNAHGLSTTAVGVSTIGNDATSIKNYIQSIYNTKGLDFVLLVGDAAQVATPTASGGASDPSYSKLAGSDDYPDVVVGRFSAETAAQVDTQVQRTITYEATHAPNQTWFKKGTGIASHQGPGDNGEYDYEHMENIRSVLMSHGYTEVDQVYDPTGTAAQVFNALNAGRGVVCYCGHGGTFDWSSTGFSSSNVYALTNDNLLPFVFSVACSNGAFSGTTCFGEAWLRATHAGQPTGAIADYMSSISQSWSSPMSAEDAFIDFLVNTSHVTFGQLCFAASSVMMDKYGADGVNMFNTWHYFGDPSLRLVPETGGSIKLPLHYLDIIIVPPWPDPVDEVPPQEKGDVKIEHLDTFQAKLTAQAKAGYAFNHWEGDVPEGQGTDNPLNLSLTGNATLTPVFVPQTATSCCPTMAAPPAMLLTGMTLLLMTSRRRRHMQARCPLRKGATQRGDVKSA
jgi:hypothetical protein